MKNKGLKVEQQIDLPLEYKGHYLGIGYRLDLLVEDKVIIEIKSVAELSSVHYKQLLTYLKLSNKKLGLLVNFNSANIRNNIIRMVNNL